MTTLLSPIQPSSVIAKHPVCRIEAKRLHSNASILLEDSSIIWQVRSGTIAVFIIPVVNGIPKGRRQYLFTVKAGEMMFSIPTAVNYQLLAVALEETTLNAIPTSLFCQEMAKSPFKAIGKMEAWIHHLGLTLSQFRPIVPATKLVGCGILDQGEIFQPLQGQLSWTRILQGQVRFVGLKDLQISSDLGYLPLSSHLWVQAQTIVEMDVTPQDRIHHPETFLAGLQTVQSMILGALQALEDQKNQQEIDRIQEQRSLNAKSMTQTLDRLSSLFKPIQRQQRHSQILSQQKPQTHEAALIQAAQVVGQRLNLQITAPAPSEDLRRVGDLTDAIARASQIRTRRVVLQENWWTQDCGPLLAYMEEDDRPVALLPKSEHSYEILDPLHQTCHPCHSSIAKQLAPIAYTFYRPFPHVIDPMALLKFATWGHQKEVITLILTGIAATLVGMVTPYATGLIIDEAIHSHDRSLLWQMGYGLIAASIGATLFQLTQGFAILRLESFADSSTQSAVWDRLLKLPVSFFRQYSVGDLSSRVSAIVKIRQKLSTTILKTLFSSLFSLLNLGLLFSYSANLALIATGVALLNIAVTTTVGIMTLRQTRPLLNEQGKLFGIMVQMINGVSKFRLAGAENRAFAYWGNQYAHQLRLMMATQGIEDNLAVINKLLTTVTPAVLFIFATFMLQQSQSQGQSFTTGTFLAFNSAFGTFISGTTSLSKIAIEILETLPIWERTQPILQTIPEIDLDKSDPGRLTGKLSVERVLFRYRSDGNLILNDVTIKAEPGEFIALVGPSGSGKSTLLRMLLGFDFPESGGIYYDGQDLSGLDIPAVRRQLGVVLQNSRLMSASIFENIASGALITMDEAWEASKMAGFADDVLAMPMGMHTVVSEGGSNISGGQRQRLMIARALALRPRILFFDEATSALDNRTQAIVSESLDRLKVTRVVVAHRLSTIRNADRIYVLQAGQIMEEGNFEQLSQQDGLFSQLIQRQKL
jgi:NHLM bacteriocin system ABC transporter ATP-binding protein